MELSTNFQFISTDKFYKKDVRSEAKTFNGFKSQYEYLRLAYGVSNKLTLSLESGYYFNKKETGLNGDPATTYTSHGIGDLILFPRYNVFNKTKENIKTDVTIGLGFKIPLGSYNDSTGNIEPFTQQIYYTTKPQAVQLASGAQDLIFYTLFSLANTSNKINLSSNVIYIKKGWNPNGEKLGDYFSIGLFAGRPIYKKLACNLQLRYEWVDRMNINQNVLLYGKPSNYYPEATGYKKVFITPQLNVSWNKFSMYASTDLPVYQYINSSPHYTQVGSKIQATLGISYRFFLLNKNDNPALIGKYYCPMHLNVISEQPGICPECGMDLIKDK